MAASRCDSRQHNLLTDLQVCEERGHVRQGCDRRRDGGAKIAVTVRPFDLTVTPYEIGSGCAMLTESAATNETGVANPVRGSRDARVEPQMKRFHSPSIFYSFSGNLAGMIDLNPLAMGGAQS